MDSNLSAKLSRLWAGSTGRVQPVTSASRAATGAGSRHQRGGKQPSGESPGQHGCRPERGQISAPKRLTPVLIGLRLTRRPSVCCLHCALQQPATARPQGGDGGRGGGGGMGGSRECAAAIAKEEKLVSKAVDVVQRCHGVVVVVVVVVAGGGGGGGGEASGGGRCGRQCVRHPHPLRPSTSSIILSAFP